MGIHHHTSTSSNFVAMHQLLSFCEAISTIKRQNAWNYVTQTERQRVSERVRLFTFYVCFNLIVCQQLKIQHDNHTKKR